MAAVTEVPEQALSIAEAAEASGPSVRNLELIEWKIRFYEERLGRT